MDFAETPPPSAILTSILYLIFSVVLLYTSDEGRAAVFGCANAALLAALLLMPRRRWGRLIVGCAAATVLANLLTGRPLMVAVAFGAVNLITPVTAALALQRWSGAAAAARVDSPSSAVRFGLVAGFATPALGALAGAAVLAEAFGASFGRSWLVWVATEGAGLLLMTPLLLMLWQDDIVGGFRRAPPQQRWLSAGLLVATVVGGIVSFSTDAAPLLFVPALLIVVTAFGAGRAGATLAVLATALIGAALTDHATGQLALVAGDRNMQVLFLQGFLAIVLLVALPVAATLEERERLVEALGRSEQRFRALAENSTDLIVWSDREGVCRYASPAAAELLGRDPALLLDAPIVALIHRDDRSEVEDKQRQLIERPSKAEVLTYRARHAEGYWLWLEARGRSTVSPGGRVTGVQWTVRDISQHKSMEAMLSEAANTDALTGIANRRAFATLLDIAVTRARSDGGPLSLAMIDIDHFKQVNDRFGHGVGDAALRMMASACQQMTRQGDMFARVGGEEFALLMPATDSVQAQLASERLRETVARLAVPAAGGFISITVSIGLALFEADEDAQELVRAADRALYAAKEAGRDRVVLARARHIDSERDGAPVDL